MKPLNLVFILTLSFTTAFGQKEDTVHMLTNNDVKYWDKVDSSLSSANRKMISWRFTKKSNTIFEYYYDQSKSKRRHENNYGDFILGETPFRLRFDTLILPELRDRFIIKYLSKDTFILWQIQHGLIDNHVMFVKSQDQKQKPKPVLGNLKKPQKLEK